MVQYVSITKTVHRSSYVTDLIEYALAHAPSTNVEIMLNVSLQIMAFNVNVMLVSPVTRS